MKHIALILFFSSTFFLSVQGHSAKVVHNKAFGGYSTFATFSGFLAGGEYKFHDKVKALAQFASYSKSGFSITQLELGAAYIHELSRDMHITGGALFISSGGDASGSELGIFGGIDKQFNRKLVAGGKLMLVDGVMEISGHGDYKINDEFAAGGELALFDGETNITIAGYYYF